MSRSQSKKEVPSSEWITLQELSRRLDIKITTLRSWRYEGRIPDSASRKFGPRLVRYNWDEIKDWLGI